MVLPETPEEALSVDACSTLVLRPTTTRVIKSVIAAGRIVCVLDNGVVEAYRYGLSEQVRQTLSNDQQQQALNSTRRRIADSKSLRKMKEYSVKSSIELKKLTTKLDAEITRFVLDEIPSFTGDGTYATSRSNSPSERTKVSTNPLVLKNAAKLESNPETSSTGNNSIHAPIAPLQEASSSRSNSPRPKGQQLIVLVDKDVSPFTVLPRIPLAAAALQRSSGRTAYKVDLSSFILLAFA